MTSAGRALVATILVLVGALALGLRLRNNDFGLPRLYHTDEAAKVEAINTLRTSGPLDPRYYLHPGFLIYTVAGASWVARSVLGMPASDATTLLAGRTWIGVLGTLTVLATFFLIREMVRGALATAGEPEERDGASHEPEPAQWLSTACGLAAAAFLAVVPLHVVTSHYVKEDVPLTLWMTLTTVFSVRIARRGERRDYILAAVFAAFSLASKYIGALAFPMVAVAHFQYVLAQRSKSNPLWVNLRVRSGWLALALIVGVGGATAVAFSTFAPPALALLAGIVAAVTAGWFVRFAPEVPGAYWTWQRLQRWVSLGLLVGCVFAAFNPALVTNFNELVRGWGWEQKHAMFGHGDLVISPWTYGWTFHLTRSLYPGVGLPLLLMALLGLALSFWVRERGVRLGVFTVVAWYLLHESSPLKPPPNFDRYMDPILPLLCGAASFAVFSLWLARARPARNAARGSGVVVPPWRRVVTGALVVAGVASWATAYRRSAALVTDMKPDTRDRAVEWLTANLPRGAVVVTEHLGVRLDRDSHFGAVLTTRNVLGDELPGMKWEPSDGVATLTGPSGEQRSWVVDAVVTSSFSRDRYFDFPAKQGSRRDRVRQAYERLEREWGPPAATFESATGPYGFNNPTIHIYLRPLPR